MRGQAMHHIQNNGQIAVIQHACLDVIFSHFLDSYCAQVKPTDTTDAQLKCYAMPYGTTLKKTLYNNMF